MVMFYPASHPGTSPREPLRLEIYDIHMEREILLFVTGPSITGPVTFAKIASNCNWSWPNVSNSSNYLPMAQIPRTETATSGSK